MINYGNFEQPTDCPVKAGQHYKHYKQGNMYTVICIALDSETQEYMVVYQGWLSGKVWVRSVKDFTAFIGEEDFSEPRFRLAEAPDPVVITSLEQFLKTFGVPKNDSRIQEEDTFNRCE